MYNLQQTSACFMCTPFYTVGRVLIVVKSSQIVNPIIAMDDPVPYCSIRARLCLRIY